MCLFIVTSLGCLMFTVQYDVCAETDTRRLFLLSSAEEGKNLTHIKSDFDM